jgi:hypothetical protein
MHWKIPFGAFTQAPLNLFDVSKFFNDQVLVVDFIHLKKVSNLTNVDLLKW